MEKRFYLAFIFATILMILPGCSGKPNPAQEQTRQDSGRMTDSIASVEKAIDESEETARHRPDSINEAESLKPSCFIKRSSSVAYEFLDAREINSNLKKLGFSKIHHKESDWINGIPDDVNGSYKKETTIFSRSLNNEDTKITEIEYFVDWEGYCSDEFYFTVSFPNEKSKKAFLEEVLKMNFVKQEGSVIIIGAGKEYENLYIADSGALQIIFYSSEGLNFHNYNP